MSSAIVRRIIYGMILVLAVVVLDFLLIQAAPGDVVDVILTEAGGPIRQSLIKFVLHMG